MSDPFGYIGSNHEPKAMKLFQFRRSPKVSEAYTYRNLAVYLLSPPATSAKGTFLTLDEALQAGCARLHETGRVGELEIENLTQADLYVQAGDVVKGGWQDRALGLDFIVPRGQRRSQRMKVRTFCVERGRWNRRNGEEPTNTFKSSPFLAASRELKLSIREAASQTAVWSSVDAAQAKLSQSIGADVRAAHSPTSLPLTLENDAVRRRMSGYVDAFHNLLSLQPDAAGFAFAINGRINSADAYASPELFRKLWPRLLEAAALEALAESTAAGPTCSTPTAVEIAAWLRRAGRGRKTKHPVTARVTLVVRESEEHICFETMDAEQPDVCVHQSILAR